MQKDSWDIDYQATLNALQAARQSGAAHFVLLSAICVQKPLLEFQRAKLKFEAALQVWLLFYTRAGPPSMLHCKGMSACHASSAASTAIQLQYVAALMSCPSSTRTSFTAGSHHLLNHLTVGKDVTQEAGDITYSIVRPTAFFKSIAGQARSCPGDCLALCWSISDVQPLADLRLCSCFTNYPLSTE